VNYKRKRRRRFFLLMRSRTPPISSEFRAGGGGELNPPQPPPLGTPLAEHNLMSWLETYTQPISSEPFHEDQGSNLLDNQFCHVFEEAINKTKQIMYSVWHKYTSMFILLLLFCFLMCIFVNCICLVCRCQWPRCLRRRSSGHRLLRLWVRIPPGVGMFVVSVVYCQIEVSATDWSLVRRIPTDCGVSLCVIKKPRKQGG